MCHPISVWNRPVGPAARTPQCYSSAIWLSSGEAARVVIVLGSRETRIALPPFATMALLVRHASGNDSLENTARTKIRSQAGSESTASNQESHHGKQAIRGQKASEATVQNQSTWQPLTARVRARRS